MNDIDIGEVAYNAYCNACNWRSVEGQPSWANQTGEVRNIWRETAAAVVAAVVDTIEQKTQKRMELTCKVEAE